MLTLHHLISLPHTCSTCHYIYEPMHTDVSAVYKNTDDKTQSILILQDKNDLKLMNQDFSSNQY